MIQPVMLVSIISRNRICMISSSNGRLIKMNSTTTIDVDIMYSRLISPFVYPRIFAMEIDCAFFSMMILDRRYINTRKILTENPSIRFIILPMDTSSCLEILVRSSTSMVEPIYFSSISVISESEKYPLKLSLSISNVLLSSCIGINMESEPT